ncbi:hypothetical protein [Oceanobacillus alkalisoli]|nr:hypothetical protein [Oceanobacillus alkalisoli]MCF3943362.1 hypothetical protein [Oceanobacillus alkalisoli]
MRPLSASPAVKNELQFFIAHGKREVSGLRIPERPFLLMENHHSMKTT